MKKFGRLYGPSDSDIAAVTNWLQNHGFRIDQVSKGRINIEFSGTARQVEEAFHTEIHNYLVNGKAHLSNNQDPQIPAALEPVVIGVASLHNFFPVHQSVLGRYVRRDPKTGAVTPVEPELSGPKPEYGFTNQDGNPQEDITPYDFATIYNLLPLWNAGITGKGINIAISAVTDLNASDITTFRKTLGLGSFTGTVTQVHNGSDPGIVQGALVENTLDTEWSGAAAPDANINVIISASTSTTFGGILSDSYIVDNPTVAQIMSASYGGCEIILGTAGNANNNSIYQQGSTEGISMFESSGDQGSTGCDNSDATTFPNPAQYGLQVNGDASPPYITAVGGTEFTWQNFRTTYWSATNSSANGSNALGYIPESPWDGTCTSQLLLDRFWDPQYGFTTLEQVCNEVVSGNVVSAPNFLTVTGGSGGVSACTTSDGSTFASCKGGYAKPSWQTGTGVPNDGKRDLPDVSLFASSGFPYGLNGSAYLICVASNSPDKSCNYSSNTQIIYQEVGGTSVSSPAMAGIMALVQQKQGSPQGLANPVLYKLAAKDNRSACNSSTVSNGNSCNFYDITYGNIRQPCATGARDCTTSVSGDAYGIVNGYDTTTGYDLATGLGSVNAANLVNNWASVTAQPAVTLSPTSLAFGSVTSGTTSAAKVVTVKNTGTGTLTFTTGGITITGTGAADFVKSATTCGTTLAATASCTISVEFKPASAAGFTAALSIADNATGSPQTVALTGTGTPAVTETVSLSPTSIAFGSLAVGTTSAAKVVTIKNTGTGAVNLTSETITGTGAADFVKSATTCTSTLAVGASCTVSVEFKPASAASFTAALSIADNATGTPQTVALTGTGTQASGPIVTLTPTTIAFSPEVKGTASDAQVITVKNTGTATLTLTSIALGGTNPTSFQELSGCGTTLAANASCMVYVAFEPATSGALSGTVTFTDNATGSPQKVTLTGTGTTAPTAKVSVTSLAFGTVKSGTTSEAKLVTLTNSGTAALPILGISLVGTSLVGTSLVGTSPSSFEQLNTCTASLAPSASCSIYVAFKPKATGAVSATLSIIDQGSTTTQTVALTGTGD
jgi:subtilase family serine protease